MILLVGSYHFWILRSIPYSAYNENCRRNHWPHSLMALTLHDAFKKQWVSYGSYYCCYFVTTTHCRLLQWERLNWRWCCSECWEAVLVVAKSGAYSVCSFGISVVVVVVSVVCDGLCSWLILAVLYTLCTYYTNNMVTFHNTYFKSLINSFREGLTSMMDKVVSPMLPWYYNISLQSGITSKYCLGLLLLGEVSQ